MQSLDVKDSNSLSLSSSSSLHNDFEVSNQNNPDTDFDLDLVLSQSPTDESLKLCTSLGIDFQKMNQSNQSSQSNQMNQSSESSDLDDKDGDVDMMTSVKMEDNLKKSSRHDPVIKHDNKKENTKLMGKPIEMHNSKSRKKNEIIIPQTQAPTSSITIKGEKLERELPSDSMQPSLNSSAVTKPHSVSFEIVNIDLDQLSNNPLTNTFKFDIDTPFLNVKKSDVKDVKDVMSSRRLVFVFDA